MTPWRLAAGLLAAAVYALFSHWLTLMSAGQPWALAAVVAPFWFIGLLLALRRGQRWALVALAGVAAVVAVVVALGGLADVNLLYLLQHAGIHLALFASFGLSLRPGRTSLIGGVAARVHGGTLTPAMWAYTHRVTAAWAAYFLAMALLSVWVFLALDWASWSLLANVLTPLAIGAVFIGEYLLRYWLHPEFERASLMDAARAYSRPADTR